MQDTQSRTGENSQLPWATFNFFHMQDTQSRTGENTQLPASEQHLTFFTCRIPSSGQEKILFYFFHMQDTQFRTGENYFFLFSHAGYPVQDRRKLFFTFFTYRIPSSGQEKIIFYFFHMQDTQSRTGENSQLPTSFTHLNPGKQMNA